MASVHTPLKRPAVILGIFNVIFVFMKCSLNRNFFVADSVYSERYMRSPKPEDNYVNYQQSSVSMKAEHIRGKKFLLIHGTADGKLSKMYD